jgi:hypothetical protein
MKFTENAPCWLEVFCKILLEVVHLTSKVLFFRRCSPDSLLLIHGFTGRKYHDSILIELKEVFEDLKAFLIEFSFILVNINLPVFIDFIVSVSDDSNHHV